MLCCGEDVEALLAAQPLQPGQLVWVCKSKGLKRRKNRKTDQQRLEPFLRARILSLDADGSDDPSNDPRLTVVYPKGSTYRVRRSHIWPIACPDGPLRLDTIQKKNLNDAITNPNNGSGCETMVWVWSETDVYRRCCVQHVLPTDYFVEVGCDAGLTVAKVAETLMAPPHSHTPPSHQVLGIDKSTESIATARQRYPHLPFVQWDLLLDPKPPEPPNSVVESRQDIPNRPVENAPADENIVCAWDYLQSRQQQQGSVEDERGVPECPLVVAMDINGNRELDAVQKCLRLIQSLWRPRLIVVKSRALHNHIVN